MVNKVILIGTLGADPEIKNFDNGKLANISLATNETYKNKAGEKVQNTDWHKLKISIPSLVDIAEKYLKKGSSIYCEGKIKYRNYEKDGNKLYITEIVVDTIRFIPKGAGVGKDGNNTETTNNSTAQSQPDDFSPITQDDDLPF